MHSHKIRNGILVIPIGLVLISLLGCSQFGPNSPNVRNAMDMLRIERDAAEDEYYALKQEHDEALWKIEDLESQLKSIQEDDRTMGVSYEEVESIDSMDRGFNTSFENANSSFKKNGAPGSGSISPNETTRPNEDADYVEPASNGIRKSSSKRSTESGESDVSYIDIEPRMTRGFDSHGKSGADGIVVAIKPMDSSNQFLAIAAPVTISLIDPAQKGIRQRVGLWKFTAKQVANRIDFDNKVFLFRLPWQRSAPVHSDLKLFIRYEANDGMREAEMDLPVSIDDAPTSSWKTVQPGPDAENVAPRTTFTMSDSNTDSDQPSSDANSPLQIARPEWSPYR